MVPLCLRGRVFSGKGGGAKFVDLQWVKRQIEEKLGFTPYPGTLNLRLTGTSVRTKKMLMKKVELEILPAPGFCTGKLLQANIKNLKCAVVIPQVPDYPENVIEVISSTRLRERLNLFDGSLVEVQVTF